MEAEITDQKSPGDGIKFTGLEHTPTIGKLAEALAAAQGEMVGAKKDGANPHYKSVYATLAAVVSAIREPLSKNNIAHVQSPGCDEHGDFMDTMLVHSSGEWMKGRIRMKPVKDDPQGIGSVITYMRRYALQAMTGLEAEDDDGNKASGQDGYQKPKLPATKPLPSGSYQQALTVEKPPQAKPEPITGVQGWKSVRVHIGTSKGKVNGRELGTLSKSSFEWVRDQMAKVAEPTKEDNILIAAIAMADAEKGGIAVASPRNTLLTWCEEDGVTLKAIVILNQKNGSKAQTFDEIPEEEINYMLEKWDIVLPMAKDEMDQLSN